MPESRDQENERGQESPEQRLLQNRRQKLLELAARGEACPYRYDPTHDSEALRRQEAELTAAGATVRVAGRLMAKRGAGKTMFAPLQDGSGRVQLYFRRDDLGEERFETALKLLDIGDLIGAEGTLFRTRTGELTVHVTAFQLLAKALRPLPEKFHEMSLELKSRRRHLDLIMNPESRERFRRRSLIISHLRDFFGREGFLEVETPALQPLYGGASARPFTTWHHALDRRLYLRIADELYLKRLIVGGLDRVFEIAKDFRNEGMDRTHNPEFTMLEAYAAWWDYTDMRDLTERLLRELARRFGHEGRLTYGDAVIDCEAPFARVRFLDALAERAGEDLRGLDREAAAAAARRHGVPVTPQMGRDRILDALFSALVEPHLVQPTFVLDHPRELSPLARTHREDPELAERFELFVAGFELANSFSELNDPEEQRRRFLDQKALLARGDEEAQVLDEDFLETMEAGMPPTGGLGLGVDRLVMLLTDSHSIRDVLLFPQLRPEESGDERSPLDGPGQDPQAAAGGEPARNEP